MHSVSLPSARAVFRPNEKHLQQDAFGIEMQLSPELRKRLRESKEYAFYKEVFCRIPEALFADLYDASAATRPNVPVNQLVGALILQHLKDWTVEELLDHLAFDVKTRAALGLGHFGEEVFCKATLYNFQGRLRDDMVRTGRDRFQVVFDGFNENDLERFGIKSTTQRCDSIQMGSNIRQFTRIELLVEVVLRMWSVLSKADQALHDERFTSYVKARTSGQFLYRLRKSEYGETLERLGAFYAWMVEALETGYGTTEIYHIVCRLFAEQFTRIEEKITVRVPEEIRSDSLQSPDDVDATYRKKDGESFLGFVLHATETADPENPFQLITDVVVAPNNQDDSRILHDRLPAMKEKTPDLRELHTDATYGSEENDLLQAELEIAAVQTAIRGHLSPAPFCIERDEAGSFQIRCSGGHVVAGGTTKTRFKAVFPAAACEGCPFAGVCPGQPLARGGRVHYFEEADVLRQERHRRLKELPEERRTLRANVEATMKEFGAPRRNGKLRTRGLYTASRYGYLRAIGINFGRIYRHLRQLPWPQHIPAPSRPRPEAAARPTTLPPSLLQGLRSRFHRFVAFRNSRISPCTAFARLPKAYNAVTC
jgi:hypothetical protein